MRKKVFPPIFAFLFIIPMMKAQLVVDSLTVVNYVQNILLGGGIQATNITFTGCFNQIGYMHGGETVGLSIPSGLVLSTEHVQNITVPSPIKSISDDNCTGVNNDPDLVTIANSVPPLIGQFFNVIQVKDKSILEFDFVPTGDTLRFNYIFGSDEYLEWVNSSYNDVFAFLLSGPGITGPYAAPSGFPGGAVNIAHLPGTSPPLPITVSSVNNLLNSDFYIDNPSNQNISIDGYTVKLEASHAVQCGQKYHIKLAIADGTDGSLESIVILEEKSFSSAPVISVNISMDIGPPGTQLMYEDCGLATIVFSRSPNSDLTEEDSAIIHWSGTAIMGIDYNTMPESIVFPPGVSSVTYYLDALSDGITEGTENVIVQILNPAVCGENDLVSSFEFFIADVPNPLVVSGFDSNLCLGNAITLAPVVSGGYGNFQYQWSSTNETTPSIHPTPTTTSDYFLTLSDTCAMPPQTVNFHITVLDFLPLSVEINNNDVILLPCYDTEVFTATVNGGDGNYTYLWTNGLGQNLFSDSDTLLYPSGYGEGPVILSVTDGCATLVSDTITVTLDIPDMVIDIPESLVVQCNEPFSFQANVSSGLPPYNFFWSTGNQPDWGQTSNSYTNPGLNQPVQVLMTVSDDCGQSESHTVNITIDTVPPIDLTLIDDVSGNCLDVFNLQPVVGGGSGGFVYSWTDNTTQLGNSTSILYNSHASTQVYLFVTDACHATAYDTVNVSIVNPPIAIEIGDDIQASCIDHTQLTPTVAGGTGAIHYSWFVNQSLQNNQQPDFSVQSFETIQVGVMVEDACGQTGTDYLTIHIPDIPVTITTSPDTSVCPNGIIHLTALATGGEAGYYYSWSPAGGNADEAIIGGIKMSEIYSVTATDICGRSATSHIQVTVVPVSAGFLTTDFGENQYAFTAMDEPYCSHCQYFWDMGDGTTADDLTIEHTFDGIQAYQVELIAMNDIGCIDSAYYTIKIPPIIYIPNSFTPNGDGINDTWSVVAGEVRTFDLKIYNRWGELLFSTQDAAQPWTGDRNNESTYYAPNDVYIYRIKATGWKQEVFEKTGSITLAR